MIDENDPTPEQENEDNHEAEGESPDLSGLFGAMFGAASPPVHEGGVHGSVLLQTRDFCEEYMRPEMVELTVPDGLRVPVAISKDGVEVIAPERFEAWRDAPRHRKGVATMTDLTSFIGHVNRYKDEHSVIFAKDDQTMPGLTAVLDYHEDGAEGAPRFGHHRTQFNFPVTPEWQAWTGNNAQAMDHTTFAKFIEDRFIEIIPPAVVASSFSGDDDPVKRFVDGLGGVAKMGSAADLMRIASGLSVHESSVLAEATRLQSGEGRLVFQIDHETRDSGGEVITVPPAFGIAVPVFKGEPPYCVIARLRYRKSGGKLALWYELFRADLTFDHAVNEAIEKVQNETGLTVWKGQPEA